jgi:hypothetical protein
MILEIRFDAGRPRRWMQRAIAVLANDKVNVQVAALDAGAPKPVGLDALFELERLLLRRSVQGGADPISLDEVLLSHPVAATPDLIIDFRPDAAVASPAIRTLTPLFDGAAGEDAILAAVMAGDMPVIEVVDSQAGGAVARGHPSAENAAALSGALDSVMARTVVLLARIIAGDATLPALGQVTPRHRTAPSPARHVLKGLAVEFVREIYRLCCYAPHWHVGWRHVDDKDVWDRGDLSGPAWHVVPDPKVAFYADPFPVRWDGRTFVFVEELDHRVGKGFISALEFDERGPKGLARPVLEENWHLSYPFLIEHDGSLWMIPESMGNRDVAIYRCVAFPDRWERFATLVSNVELSDATIVQHNGMYYLFGVQWDGAGGYSDLLAIYCADDLFGPWRPHAGNPVLVDRSTARPAGNFVQRNGRLWRPVQDCATGYGSALALAEISELTPTSFSQVVHKVLKPGEFWPGRKLHTLNRSGRLEVIDGSRIQPKPTALAAAWTRSKS